jgi:hypothetical protein
MRIGTNLWWFDLFDDGMSWTREEQQVRFRFCLLAIPIFFVILPAAAWLLGHVVSDRRVVAIICAIPSLPASLYVARGVGAGLWRDLLRRADSSAAQRVQNRN